ncbi:uncharacterized protein LY89DRAFT_740996 [Mollisia scopiformis]|uniref:C2H2-type domain-containing protein n=1 Tax=Mollisia scopiformis TaxID=149040 RepID=A0A132BB94_MOLSC|nr:uncharacterized protein LY89DRAFT_740996 [Mollisia scopiformis]KUJ09269.1 hypothetical protein LY89DRAFT_740996 [Mollisia scopiformis]
MDYQKKGSGLLHIIPYKVTQENHAHPRKELSSTSLEFKNTELKESEFVISLMTPPKKIQYLHYRCTITDCGQEFKNHDDLTTHLIELHWNIDLSMAPVRRNSGDSAGSSVTMDSNTSVTTAEVKSVTGKEAEPTSSPVQEEEVVVGKMAEVRPASKRRASKMSRNAVANPGASDWRSH